MDNFKREVRNNLLIFGGIVVVFVGFILVAKGQVTGISSRIAGVQSLINQQRTISSQLITLREDRELSLKYERVMNVLVPTERQTYDFPEWLRSQSQIYNVGLTFSYAGEPKKPEEKVLGTVPFSLKLTGKFSELASFIDFLENKTPQYLMAFDDFGTGVSRDGVNQLTIKGRVYFRANE